jgi:hypothetical protein
VDVPDTSDYEAFAELLARPGSWTAQERRLVEFALQQQRDLLAACHPKDLKGRARLTKVVESIQSARGSHSPSGDTTD